MKVGMVVVVTADDLHCTLDWTHWKHLKKLWGFWCFVSGIVPGH